jgi:hypothetical protein
MQEEVRWQGRAMTRRRAMTFVAAIACTVLASGCNAHPADQAKNDSSVSPSTSTVPELKGMPDPGTCWKVSAAIPGDHWFDASRKVSCIQEHTAQTAGAFTVPEPTVAMAKRVAGHCVERVRTFFGIDEDHWFPWEVLVFLPSKQQIAHGAKWVRCDAAIPETTTGSQWGDVLSWKAVDGPARLLSVNRSVKGAALRPPAELRACTLGSPQEPGQRMHECGVMHRYEATGTLAVLDGLTSYPSPAQRKRQGARLCRQELTADQRSRALTAFAQWDPPAALADGDLVAVCWAYSPNGKLLPPRR